GDDSLAQTYVSTTYAILAIVFGILWLSFIIANQFLDWTSILKVSHSMKSEVATLALIVFTYFCLQFVLRILTTILTADQHPAKVSIIDLCGQILSLIFVVFLVMTTEG